MRLAAASTLLTLIWSATFALGRPVHNKVISVRSDYDDYHGAAYFITNDPAGNFVVSADIMADGSLIWRDAVLAGGQGAHGKSTTVGPDALFSQGAVTTSINGRILATVNAGSNTVAVFSINSLRPSGLTMLGHPFSSQGQFPVSVAINHNGTSLCVLNGGEVSGVSCFIIDIELGLVTKPNTLRTLPLNQTTPATGPAGSASQLVFSEDGTQLIASIKGAPPTPGYLAVWEVAKDGSLSQDHIAMASPAGGLSPFSMTVIPGKNALLVTDPGVGFDIVDMSTGGNSSKSSAVPIPGQSATGWSSYSNKTGNYYLTDINTSIVTEVNVDQDLKGTVVKQYQQQNLSATIDSKIATIGDKDFLYVLAPNATAVQVFALDGPGNATSFGSFDFAGPFNGTDLPIDPNNIQGMSLYVKPVRV